MNILKNLYIFLYKICKFETNFNSFKNKFKILINIISIMSSEDIRLTKEWIKKFLRKEHRLYYGTPELNDALYLHYKGFRKLENLDEFTGLKVLYFEGNALSVIENLDNLTNLRCLYL